MGDYLKVADQEICSRRAERDQDMVEKTKEVELRRQLYLLQEKMNLLKEEMARDRLYKENLEVKRRQGLVKLVKEHRRVADLEQQAQATIEEMKTEVRSWKRSNNNDAKDTCLPTWVHSTFQRQQPPYGIPYGWNTNVEEHQATKEYKQAGVNNIGARPNQGSRAKPNQGSGIGANQGSRAEPTLGFRVGSTPTFGANTYIQAGSALVTDCYGLDIVDLCLVLDVGFLIDFKTPEFEKYKGSSYPRVHLATYCRKMTAYIHDDKILVHCFQDNLTRAALN
ncbi:hypothetical protein CR513_14913, partial [Mucuna pruriens]